MAVALLNLSHGIFGLIGFLVIASAIVSWLIAFDIINTRNPTVNQITRALYAVVDPMLRPIRRFLPTPGGLDFSPIVLLILIKFLSDLIDWAIVRFLLPVTG